MKGWRASLRLVWVYSIRFDAIAGESHRGIGGNRFQLAANGKCAITDCGGFKYLLLRFWQDFGQDYVNYLITWRRRYMDTGTKKRYQQKLLYMF